jgi:hypothetical protein
MSPELLKNSSQYKNLLSVVESSEWLLFISTFIRRKNPVTKIYWSYLLSGFIGVLYLISTSDAVIIEARYWIIGITGGLLISLLISPVLHELIQTIFFKIYGAEKVNFKWNWKLFRFKIQATDFVVSKRKYYLICSFTFILFSILPFILAFYSANTVLFALLSLSFFHALYAMKDLAVCSYLHKFPNCFIYSSEDNKIIFYKALP